MAITPSLSAMASTTNPAGIKDDKRKFLTMVLIPLGKQHDASIQNHQN